MHHLEKKCCQVSWHTIKCTPVSEMFSKKDACPKDKTKNKWNVKKKKKKEAKTYLHSNTNQPTNQPKEPTKNKKIEKTQQK